MESERRATLLSLGHFEAIIGLLTALLSISLCLGDGGGLRRGSAEPLAGGAVRTHAKQLHRIKDLGCQISMTNNKLEKLGIL